MHNGFLKHYYGIVSDLVTLCKIKAEVIILVYYFHVFILAIYFCSLIFQTRQPCAHCFKEEHCNRAQKRNLSTQNFVITRA